MFPRVSEVIHEDDVNASLEPVSSIDQTPAPTHNVLKEQNVMSSTFNESAASRSLLLAEMEKENLPSPAVLRSPTKRARVHYADDHQLNGNEALHEAALAGRLDAMVAQQDSHNSAMAERLDAMEAKQDEQTDAIMQRLREMDVFVKFKLWTMEDTDLMLLRTGLEEVNETVAMLARSDQFIRQYAALKDENALLKAKLRASQTELGAAKSKSEVE